MQERNLINGILMAAIAALVIAILWVQVAKAKPWILKVEPQGDYLKLFKMDQADGCTYAYENGSWQLLDAEEQRLCKDRHRQPVVLPPNVKWEMQR